MTMEYLHKEWKDEPTGYHDMEYINNWLDSETFNTIRHDAENGDLDSREAIDIIYDRMDNIFFHINNKSHRQKIDMELHKLKSYLESYS